VTAIGNQYELALHTSLVRLRGPQTPPDDVFIVAVDEASYKVLNSPMDRPLPREVYAKLITRLASLGVQRVVFDVLFLGPGANPEWDQKLAQSMSSMPVALGVQLDIREFMGTPFHEILKPDPLFADRAAALALVTMKLEEGVARQFFFPAGDEATTGFVTLSEAGAGILRPEQRSPLKMPTRSDLINFYGPLRTIKTFSLYQLLEEEVPIPAQLVRNKTAFVGLSMGTALGSAEKDSFLTPYGELFGVEIHATQAANLLDHSWLHRASVEWERSVGGVLCLLLTLLVLSLRPQWGFLTTIGVAVAWFGAAYAALDVQLFLGGGAIATIAVPICFLTSTLYWYLRTRRRQKQIESAFGYYLSPAILRQLKKDPSLLKLGGEELVCSAMFTDIAGFTSISEQLGALKVVAMLNDYFTEVSQAVLDEEGTVIKFIGDAVFALWGAPVHQDDHAARAVRAALRIQQVVDRFNAEGKYPKLLTRVGVNTGMMVAGNLGSKKRFDYTAISDAVNLASRVEGVNKYLGSTVLVTEDTLAQIAGYSEFLPLRMGAIRVVGKEIPVALYRILLEPIDGSVRLGWEQALAAFAERRWDDSEGLFHSIAEKSSDLSKACETYLEAVAEFRMTAPTERWQGELIMDHK
jgi:adenylate cyclase